MNHLSCAVKLLLKDILRQYRVRDIGFDLIKNITSKLY